MIAELTRYAHWCRAHWGIADGVFYQSSCAEACRHAHDGVPRRRPFSALTPCREPPRARRTTALPPRWAYGDSTCAWRGLDAGMEADTMAQIGGATGSVGDPSGRSTERNALSPEELNANAEAITAQVTSFLARGVPFALTRTSSRNGAGEVKGGTVRVENNLEWLGGMGLLKFLSTVGKTARMGVMLSRERSVDPSVRLSLLTFGLAAYDLASTRHRDCPLPSSHTSSSRRSTSSPSISDITARSNSADRTSWGIS